MSDLIPVERVESKIYLIRGQRVLLDFDLAKLYGIKTKVLNQAVKRNLKRFPDDFMFRLTKEETAQLVTNCDQFKRLKHSSSFPLVFTEQGVAMLSSVLKSEKAVQMNIAIVRVFVKLRQLLSSHKELAQKLNELEKRLQKHDVEIYSIFKAIRRLTAEPEKTEKRIGFLVK